MRKIGILLILILVLTAIVFFNLKQSNSTLNQVENDFAIADTASIYKIFIADKGDREVLLQRKQNDQWVVNDKYKVRKRSIDLLLETIKRIRPKHPVANAAHDNVIRNMAGNSKKVEIYEKDNDVPLKTYYLGGTNLEKNANYMFLEDAAQPYAVHIPGFTGYISGRYILKEIDWRDRTIFALRPEKIKSVNLQYPMETEKGFQLNVVDQQNFVLQSLSNKNTQPIQLKPAAALNYLQAFRFLACEAYLNDYTRTDSLLKQQPKNILTVELNDGSKQELIIYYIPVNKRSKTQFDQAGERVLYDVDRYYATFDDTKEVIMIQEYVFGKVLNTFDEMQQLSNNSLKNKKPTPVANKKQNNNSKVNKIENENLKQGKPTNSVEIRNQKPLLNKPPNLPQNNKPKPVKPNTKPEKSQNKKPVEKAKPALNKPPNPPINKKSKPANESKPKPKSKSKQKPKQ